MKSLISLIFFCFTISVTAQNVFTKTDAKQLVDTFFEGFHTGDTILMRSVLANDVVLQTATNNNLNSPVLMESSISQLLEAIANRAPDQKWDERILGYTISVDGNLAHVWTPYEFWFNGNFSHCGANAFTIAKLEAGWKIIQVIDSRRKEGCGQ